MYFCSVFVKIWFCKILRQFIRTLYNQRLVHYSSFADHLACQNSTTKTVQTVIGVLPKHITSKIITIINVTVRWLTTRGDLSQFSNHRPVSTWTYSVNSTPQSSDDAIWLPDIIIFFFGLSPLPYFLTKHDVSGVGSAPSGKESPYSHASLT
jgi:hypothetical protein